MLTKSAKPNLIGPAANAHLEPAIRSRIEALILSAVDQNWEGIVGGLGEAKTLAVQLTIDVPNNAVSMELTFNQRTKVVKSALILSEKTLPGIP